MRVLRLSIAHGRRWAHGDAPRAVLAPPGPARRRAFAVLAHTWTGQGRGAAPPSPCGPHRIAVILHGILGSKANWNTPAKRLLEHVGPLGWRVLQLDLRAHGQSPVGEPPHTLEACAEDVLETLGSLGVDPERDDIVMCGHSFGGKVALTFARARMLAGQPPPSKTWIFDSVPGSPVEHSLERQRREQSVSFVLAAVEAAARGGSYPDRSALVGALQDEHGLRKPLAQWVAQSVRTDQDGVRLAYDTEVIRAMYEEYRGTDLWSVLRSGSGRFGVVVAGRNRHAWGEENLAQLGGCGDHVQVVHLPDAGHNVHVDDLKGLLDALRPTFGGEAASA